jgi:DNA polymerase III subunit alpha
MLDGAARIPDIVSAAARDGQPALAITDHGVLYGLIEFYNECKEQGITPVLGTEAYYTPGSRFDRPRRAEHEINHMTLLAETNEGYANLVQLSSKAFLDGYFYKPRVDDELLAQHSAGLIATSGCLGGHIPQLLLSGQEKAACEVTARYREIFGPDNFFIEVMDHGVVEQEKVTPHLVELAKRTGTHLLLTNDSHYTNREDAPAHDVLLCVQTGAHIDDPERLKFEGSEFYLKPAAEMRALSLAVELPESVDNTLWIAERVAVDIAFGQMVLPDFPVPAGETQESYLRRLALDGATERWGEPLPSAARERVEHELGVICEMGFAAYFLVVADLIQWAKSQRIRVGPGRGSAAGCAVSYALGITEIDPLRYGLIFERFLNPGRRQMPDIDMDFDERGRPLVIAYASRRYGADRVAQVVTFATIKGRQAVRDAARVLGLPAGLGDRIAKMMPPLVMGRDTPLWACFTRDERYEDGYRAGSDLRVACEADPEVKQVVDVALGLEGLRRQDGIHAAAVVITRDPLTEYLPVQRKGEESELVTQYEMHAVEQLGLLKMDFLGLRNLSVIERALELIKESRGEEVDIDHVPLDDRKTFELFQSGDALGVFQFEGAPMRQLLRQMQPSRLDDIAAINALYRPGPMAHIPTYVNRRHGREPVTYLHPDLEPILGNTYGVLVYQESVIDIAHRIAGFDLPRADEFRHAVGKKKPEVVAAQRDDFISGCVDRGYERSFAEQLFAQIEPFANYGFNASHAYGYGYVAYQTAYLKANYPVEYMAALLTSVKDNKDRKPLYLAECRAMAITLTPPDVNLSELDFVARGETIPFGLSAVRNVGEGAAEAILAERGAHGPYTDFHDFCERVPTSVLNKKVMESLIKAGAFDAMGYSRRALLDVSEAIVERVLSRRRAEEAGQFSLFDAAPEGAAPVLSLDRVSIGTETWDKSQTLAFEKEMLGLYVSDHPLFGFESVLRRHVQAPLGEVGDLADGEVRTFGGVVTNLSSRYTKRGDLMMTFDLEDLESSVEVFCFPKVAHDYGHQLVPDRVVLVKGRVDHRDEPARITALEINLVDLSGEPPADSVTIQLDAGRLVPSLVERIKSVLGAHPGETPVLVKLASSTGFTVLRLGLDFCVESREGLYAELRSLLGPRAIV